MPTRLVFERLEVRDFRNLEAIELRPAPRINVIAGDNGQGKTSLLEALYFVATSRSFRTERVPEMLRQGQTTALVRAQVVEQEQRREQRAVITSKGRNLLLDGKRAGRLSSYATRTPVVVFHPGDLTLVSGSAAGRRKLLDRVALYLRPTSGDARLRFERALRDRQRALEQRGTQASDLPAYEQLIAEHGAEMGRARAEAATELTRALSSAFEALAPTSLELAAGYVPGGSDDPQLFLEELARRRAQDLRRGAATFGPQRDDYELRLDGRPARQHGSQGQQRVLTLALKSAELACVRQARGAHPVLLLDDVSSELDPTRTGAVYDFVRQLESQIFVTTTRPELFVTPEIGREERADWTLDSGRLRAACVV